MLQVINDKVYGDKIVFRIAVCDDEVHFRKLIRKILMDYMDENGVVYEIDDFESGKDFVEQGIEMTKYKIVFLDINMDKLDGMNTARKIREVSNDMFIVFVTAFINYTLEGYRVDAVRYILKNNVNFPELVYECMDAISAKMNYVVKRKKFQFNEGTREVSLERLLYIESQLHKLEFYIMEECVNKYTLYRTLNDMEKEIASRDFVRIHQSFLVNMKHITDVSRYRVLLSNGVKLNIPKARYKHVEETYVAYKGEI